VCWSGCRNQWGGGLARRATTAFAASAVLAVVVAASTAIEVFVVILGPVATSAAVATMERVRRGLRRGLGHR
jgi:hypothetical protein